MSLLLSGGEGGLGVEREYLISARLTDLIREIVHERAEVQLQLLAQCKLLGHEIILLYFGFSLTKINIFVGVFPNICLTIFASLHCCETSQIFQIWQRWKNSNKQ